MGDLEVICVNSGKYEGDTAARLALSLGQWRPRWVLLVGVAGGLNISRGHVVAASHVYALDCGKLAAGKFKRRPDQDFRSDPNLFALAELLISRQMSENPWMNAIAVPRPDGGHIRDSLAHSGPIASSNMVIDDPDHEFYKAAAATIPDAIAVEMEASGAGSAINAILQNEKLQRVGLLVIRGISDEPTSASNLQDGGSEQRRHWKPYAADAAAAFARSLVLLLAEHRGLLDGFDVTAALAPTSPEQLVQLCAEMVRKASKAKVTIAILHAEHFSTVYLSSLLQMLRAESISFECPSREGRHYSYASLMAEALKRSTHAVFLARTPDELKSGWLAYAEFLTASRKQVVVKRIAKIEK